MLEQARAKRQAEVDRIRGKPVDLVHTETCRVLPTRNDILDALPKQGVVAEVGVAFGDFSGEIMDRLAPRKLHLLDAWEGDRYGEGLKVVEEKFEIQIRNAAVELNRGSSLEILSKFPDSYFDFIYIDTTHAYDLTLAELNISQIKVKPTGFIGGHDFCSGNIVAPNVYGVIQAASLFCYERRWRYKYISIDPDTYFSFCLEKIPEV